MAVVRGCSVLLSASDVPRQDPVVQRFLGCLKEGVPGQMDNLYTVALLSYTFTLSGDEEMRSKLITYLHTKSNTQGESAGKPLPPAHASHCLWGLSQNTNVAVTSNGPITDSCPNRGPEAV